MDNLQSLKLELHTLKTEIKSLLKRRPFTRSDLAKLKELAARVRAIDSLIGRKEVGRSLNKFLTAVQNQSSFMTIAGMAIITLAFNQWISDSKLKAGQGAAHDLTTSENNQ